VAKDAGDIKTIDRNAGLACACEEAVQYRPTASRLGYDAGLAGPVDKQT